MDVRRYELAFPDSAGTGQDIVIVDRTESRGPGGHPVYADATGIVRAEISDRGEVRMLPSGGHQVPAHPLTARPLPP
ncbi:DUF6296 family protein [Streptomyces sp. NBC_00249]|uniref:DUF6296 family protein n=1 Tax=Streptomyces sp. NBC_00249 TaxID=2975690 RepID=UPI00224DC4D8|nr:DUF6296 family protein [Streptomyces sp. NBC_00249]MCX5192589.1 DUF6296 family protein [Streptomyces sp. NBC_00249]